MKYLTAIFLFVAFQSKATNYYFSTSNGNDANTGNSINTSWVTISKASPIAGDSILLKAGDVFYQTIVITSANVAYGRYGVGANPIISGFTTLMGWTNYSGNIYYASLNVPILNMVTIDGKVKGMGRYPNNTLLHYNAHVTNTKIVDTAMNSTNWTGSELVIRKQRWIWDRHTITAKNSDTLTYNALNSYGNNSIYAPIDKNGYFIQNDLRTLDTDGEWYYDTTAKRLYIYSVSMPSTRIIKASLLDRNVYVNYFTNISFIGIDFEGANTTSAYMVGTSNISFNNCNFNQQGGDGLYGIYVSNIYIRNCNINNVLNDGLYIEYMGNNIVLDNVYTYNCGVIIGAGKSGESAQEALGMNADNITVTNCHVVNSGYNGIQFSGNHAFIKGNFVDSFCLIKDDGGGIYTYSGDSDRIIRNNVVTNAIGAYAGAEAFYYENYGKAAGIYLDGSSNHTLVDYNTLRNGNWAGVFINNNHHNSVINNNISNNAMQVYVYNYNTDTHDITSMYNTFVSNANQYGLYIDNYSSDRISSFLNSDYNTYIGSYATGVKNEFSSTAVNYNLNVWQTTYSKDLHSGVTYPILPKLIISASGLKFIKNTTGMVLKNY